MNSEREKQILEFLLKQKKVTVKELAARLYVSEPSVRRDLASLEKKNLIKRIHGGAMIEETALSKNKIPFMIRELEESSSKLIIAKKHLNLLMITMLFFLMHQQVPMLLSLFLQQKITLRW